MRSGIIALLLVIATAAAAEAQIEKRFSVGGGVSFHHYPDSRFSESGPSLTPIYRLNRGRGAHEDGWGWDLKTGLSFSRMDVPMEIAGPEVRLGKLHTIPVQVGIARAYRQGPMKISGWVRGGPSFNSFDISDDAVAAQAAIGNDLESVHVKTSFVYGPGVSARYDLSSWLGLQGSYGYSIHRPTVKTIVNGVTTTETWKLDHSTATMGLVLGIF